MKVSPLLLAVTASVLVSAARAQDAIPRVERHDGPALLVRPDPSKPSQPLKVSGVSADVTVVSGIASIRLDLTFENPLDRILEGELILPLPAGASVTSMALEIDGELREASVVERERARAIFEEVVRGQADPALLEWVKGNSYRTRVYPIPAKGTKRVVLGYEQPLTDVGGSSSRLVLPLAYGTKIRTFSCKAVVFGDKAPIPSKEGLPLKFEKAGLAWKAELKGSEVMEMEPRDLVLDVALPLEGTEVVVEKGRVASDLVFVARVPVPEIKTATVKPARLTILWDASGSAAARDRAKELAFLAAYFKELGTASVKLVVFSNAVWPIDKSAFAVTEGKCEDLLAVLSKQPADGATRLACLDLKKLDADTDHFLLVSDGLSNFGEGELTPGDKPVTCVVSSAAADFALLDRVSQKGALVNVAELATAEAVLRALSESRTLLSVEGDTTNVFEVSPKAPAKIAGRVVTLTGRMKAGAKQKLTLRFGHGAVESGKVEVELDPALLADSGRLERIWASRKVDALLANKVAHEDEITRLGKAHALVTPFTSLLVLETLDQYVRYRVKPPTKWVEEWEKRIESEKQAASKSRDQRIEEVRAKWKARVEWWKKDFKYPDDLKVAGDDEKGGRGMRGGSGNQAPGDDRRSREEAPRSEPRPAAPAEAAPERNGHANADAKKADKDGSDGPTTPPPSITLKAWDPKTPYIEAFKKVTDKKALYDAYLEQRASYAASTAFFLDSADYFYGQKEPGLALRILSNLAELELESAPLLRILGYRLAQANELDLAATVFKVVARMRPEEPQSLRDLGLVQADAKHFPEAVATLEQVVLGKWDGRFPDIELIALGELNDVIRRAGSKSGATLPDDLIQALDCDLRVILTWDADACDMDLWVTEPSGEKAFYGHTATTIGGNFGKDFTQGYGPEEYIVKKAMKGTFKIQINYYGNRQQLLAGDTTIQVLVVKNWGRPNEERQAVTRRLKDKQEVLDIADVVFGK